jgi:hypothetical protein
MGQTDLYAKMGTGDIIAYKRDRKTLADLDSIDAMNARGLCRGSPGRPSIDWRVRTCG